MPDARKNKELMDRTRKWLVSDGFARKLEDLLEDKHVQRVHVETALNHISCGQVDKAREILERALK